jgi:predicted transcriptional regulator
MDTKNGHQEASISGRDLAAARTRARLTQRDLAALLQHSTRAIQIWEDGAVPAAKAHLVRSVLGAHLAGNDNPLAQYSDTALLGELAKRLDAARSNRDLPETERMPGFSQA